MIRLGVIGHGGRLSSMIRGPFRKVAPELKVVGIIDPDETGARARLAESDQSDVRFYTSLETMMREARPEALAVGTRCNLHARWATAAAAYDVPLFLEKPVAVTMRQATALERAFETSRCPVVVSFPLRVSPLCCLAQRYLADGTVGDPVHINAVNYVPYGTVYWQSFYRNFSISHGLFLQKATHDFDYMMFLMGKPLVRVSAMATVGHVFGGERPAGLHCSVCDDRDQCLESPENRRRNGTSGSQSDHACLYSVDCGNAADGTLNEDCSSALLEFADGSHGVYTQVFFTRRDAGTRGATVSGYHGTLSFDWYRNELRCVRHHVPFSVTERAGEGASHFGGDLELAYDFIGLIQGKTPSRTPIQTGLQSAYACLAAQQAVRRGRSVAVRQVGQGSEA